MERIKLFIWGDGVTPTGFSTVLHSIFERFPQNNYDIHHLGINYWGDPHDINYKVYPAMTGGDIYGFNRMRALLSSIQPNVIFLLNDVWVIDQALEIIKKTYTDLKLDLPKIIVYFPVDAEEYDRNWFRNFNIVTKTVVYTQFAYKVVKNCVPELEIEIIPHGVDTTVYKNLGIEKYDLRKQLYPETPDVWDSFIVLSAARNQPRKRLDIAMQGFKLFAEDKPQNIKYYHHGGLKDAGWDVLKLAVRYGIDQRLILTNLEPGVQKIPKNKLNLIYNVCDVGINTSFGEGWCLPCMEHAVTGAPQVVPNHSAFTELYWDCGLLVPTTYSITVEKIETVGKLVTPEDVASKLDDLYNDDLMYKSLSNKSIKKFTNERFSWDTVSKRWQELIESVL